MGNEHKGVSKGLYSVIDDWLCIPLKGHTTSLNVSVALGIIAHTINGHHVIK